MSLPGYEHVPGLTDRAFQVYLRFQSIVGEYMVTAPIPSADLEMVLRITGPEVRALRSLAWSEGKKIGSCSKGYYLARNLMEWEPTKEHIHARCQAALRNVSQVDAIEKAFITDQGELPLRGGIR